MKRRYVRKGIICKECAYCRRKLPESEFNFRADAPDQLQYYCQECNKKYCKDWSAQRKMLPNKKR